MALMARMCGFTMGGISGAGTWSYDGAELTVSPDSGSPIVIPLAEVTGITGDGYTVTLSLPGSAPDAPLAFETLTLSRLGAEGPTLLSQLRRDWLAARTWILRVTGKGEPRGYTGLVTGMDGDGAGDPFTASLFDDILIVARDGHDLDPLFLSLIEHLEFDEAAYAIHVKEWCGPEVVFSKLAGQTEEFLGRLQTARARLAAESAEQLAVALPGIPTAERVALAGLWPPGRLVEKPTLETTANSFETVFHTFLGSLPRKEEGDFLMTWAESVWLAGIHEAMSAPAATETSEPDEAHEEASGVDGAPASAGPYSFWLLAGRGDAWFLEALSVTERATYCFRGGDEIPLLVSKLLCAPHFSKEALYMPLSDLTGNKAALAIPARFLGFLAALRARFVGRAIHYSADRWRAQIESLAASASDASG